MKDLRKVICDFLTIGQYLPPSKEHYPLKDCITLETFKRYKEKALEIDFSFVTANL